MLSNQNQQSLYFCRKLIKYFKALNLDELNFIYGYSPGLLESGKYTFSSSSRQAYPSYWSKLSLSTFVQNRIPFIYEESKYFYVLNFS